MYVNQKYRRQVLLEIALVIKAAVCLRRQGEAEVRSRQIF